MFGEVRCLNIVSDYQCIVSAEDPTAAGGEIPDKGTKEHAEDTREDALPTEGVLPEVGSRTKTKVTLELATIMKVMRCE
jgi:hypothetical protein